MADSPAAAASSYKLGEDEKETSNTYAAGVSHAYCAH
jgi:hypothetical protein